MANKKKFSSNSFFLSRLKQKPVLIFKDFGIFSVFPLTKAENKEFDVTHTKNKVNTIPSKKSSNRFF